MIKFSTPTPSPNSKSCAPNLRYYMRYFRLRSASGGKGNSPSYCRFSASERSYWCTTATTAPCSLTTRPTGSRRTKGIDCTVAMGPSSLLSRCSAETRAASSPEYTK
jgi:hypothetical protein